MLPSYFDESPKAQNIAEAVFLQSVIHEPVRDRYQGVQALIRPNDSQTEEKWQNYLTEDGLR